MENPSQYQDVPKPFHACVTDDAGKSERFSFGMAIAIDIHLLEASFGNAGPPFNRLRTVTRYEDACMDEMQNKRHPVGECRSSDSGMVGTILRLRRWRVLIGVLAAMIAVPVQAGQLSVLINGKAIHLEDSPGVEFNEENWGAGLQYDFTAENRKWVPFLSASGFKDSNNNPSYYAGGGTMRRFYFGENKDRDSLYAGVGVVAFLMVRKGFENGDPFPGLLPVATVGNDRFGLNVSYIPKVDPKMVPIIFLQLRIGL